MNLYLYSKSPDKSYAAASLTDLQALIAALANPALPKNAATIDRVTSAVEGMVQNDSGEPLTIAAYDDASTVSSWVTDASTILTVGLGDLDPLASMLYCYTADFSISGSTRVGTLNLNTAELTRALYNKQAFSGRAGGVLYLHVRKSLAGVTETIGVVPITVTAGVISSSPGVVGYTYVSTGLITSSGLTMNTARLLGRSTTGIGAVEEITIGSGLDLTAGVLSLSDTSPVSSVTGTANEITASPTTGDVILSLAGPHAFSSLTSTALLLGAGTSPIAASDLTYVSPTLSVPDAFSLTSAGSLSIVGGGAAGNVTITPSGTGNITLAGTTGGVRIPSTNTAGIQVYNTSDQTTNYERLEILFSSNVAQIRTLKAGSGTLRNLNISTGSGNPAMLVRSGSSSGGSITFTSVSTATSGDIGFSFGGHTNVATSGTNIGLSLTPTYNQASGTASNTDLLINRTQTAVGSGAQNLIDAQVGAVSQWRVGNTGNSVQTGSLTSGTPNGGTAGAWKFGIRVAAVSALDTTQYIQLDVGGTLYKLALIT